MPVKQKLAYMALGGVLVLAGHVLPGLVVGSATAQGGLQDAEFNEVTVRKLTVEDPLRRGVVILRADLYGGMVVVTDTRQRAMAGISSTGTGGLLEIYPAAEDREGGYVRIGIDDHGGVLRIHGPGNPLGRVAVGVNEYGHGTVSTWDKNGYRQ